jgi:hypothetical protein
MTAPRRPPLRGDVVPSAETRRRLRGGPAG